MYNFLLLILFISGGVLLYLGYQRRSLVAGIGGAALAILALLIVSVFDIWIEALWFDALGYARRFWKVIFWKIGAGILGALFGGGLVWLLTFGKSGAPPSIGGWARLIGALAGGLWGLAQWEKVLIFVNRVSTGVTDPILQKDTGFYLFSLPLLEASYDLILQLSMVALIALFISAFVRVTGDGVELARTGRSDAPDRRFRRLYVTAAILIGVLAVGKFLNRYQLMFSEWGAVQGPGWTDDNIRLPAYAVVFVLTLLVGAALLVPALRNRLHKFLTRFGVAKEQTHLYTFAAAAALLAIVWAVPLGLLPMVFQSLRVEPNEITFEEFYISNNIEFTRKAFDLEKIEEREYPFQESFTRETAEENANLFENVRLWDWRALDAVYKQFQEIRLYYEFVDVDIDRYTFDGKYRQVMVSARELKVDNLPEQSQTFVNRRFKYTHGFGVTLTNVSEFTSEGLPDLLVKDIPPKARHPELAVDQPRIYYGELTDTPVVVNSEEEEFDYPSGEKNRYNRYDGAGGVPMHGLWKKFLFGWRFDGLRLIFSGYPRPGSRIMFRREIKERVSQIAPFLHLDADPYVALSEGRLFWIMDAYTTSDYYPYSEPFSSREAIQVDYTRTGSTTGGELQALDGINYIRNSVKVVVDAYNGSVDFYVFEPDDPLIRMWSRAFPNLFKKKEQMPESLRAHVRYPTDMLLVQGLVYSKYHMTDPAVFYNQEDLWVRATEKYYNRVQPVAPYYIMWEPPGSDETEFTLIQPFTPKNRQVLIGWIAGMCDGDNYGRLLAYKFPKEQRVLGPQQVETKIDQDRFLSGQLSLWDQRGSNVIRGNVLAIPVGETLVYVEPIYLQADTAAYPELRLVVVMQNDRMSYAESFDKALEGLWEGVRPAELPAGAAGLGMEPLIRQAQQAFSDYLRYTGEQQFGQAGEALSTLQQSLEQLVNQAGEMAPEGAEPASAE